MATGKITAVVKDLPPGKDSRFKVKAKSVHGLSESSQPSNTITAEDHRPTGKPGDLKEFYSPGYRSMGISWNDVASGHSGYVVEMDPAPPASINLANIRTHLDGSMSLKLDGLPYKNVYTFKVYAVNQTPIELVKAEEPSTLSNVKVREPYHWWGHQRDHTVEWTSTVSNSTLSGAISAASTAWHNTIQNHKSMRFCESGTKSGTTDCSSANTDNKLATAVEATDDIMVTSFTGPNDETKGCGESFACVKRKADEGGTVSEKNGVGKHMGNMYIVYESPPWGYADYEGTGQIHRRFEWTRNSSMDRTEKLDSLGNPTGIYYLYADSVAIHEFGHALGLPDFYTKAGKYAGLGGSAAIMRDVYTYTTIQAEDRLQLWAIYRFHIGPH